MKTWLVTLPLLFALMSPAFAQTDAKVIGVGLVLEENAGRFFVNQLVPGSPAERSGAIRAGDEIHEIRTDSRSEWSEVKGLTLGQVVQLIRGPLGVPVGLRLRSASGQTHEVDLIREELDLTD